MMEITAEIRALIDKAVAGVELAGDEYIDPTDGLIHRCAMLWKTRLLHAPLYLPVSAGG